MPWEDIGSVGLGSSPYGWDLTAWTLRFAKEYILFACGEAPPGSEMNIVFHDHDLGSYPSLGVWSEQSPPWDYIRRCERALEVFDGAIAWTELVEHFRQECEREDEREAESDRDGEGEPKEENEAGEEGERHVASGDANFTVRVADNFHYMDEDETYTLGEFDTWEEAVEAARAIVDTCLPDKYEPGMTAEVLFAEYTSFGDDPYIVPTPAGAEFSAWGYAKERCAALCGSAPALPDE